MWPIEVIRAINDPEKHAKTKEQKKKLYEMRNITGGNMSLQIEKIKKDKKK